MKNQEKKDRLQVLKERLNTEEILGDKERVAKKVGIGLQTVYRVLDQKKYADLKTVKRQAIVNEFLKMLNTRKEEEAKLDAELIGK